MIETTRLRIHPLTPTQLRLYILADNSLEQTLGLNPTTRTISPELKEALEETILPNVADPKNNYLYGTLWTMIDKSAQKMVGDLCFVGSPDGDGNIEIGYGTYEDSRNKGYMTEAVGAMVEWAARQPEIKAVIADTDKDNTASWGVLEKNNFVRYGETETLFRWRIEVKK